MLFLLLARLVRAVKNVSDGFSLVLAKNDLNAISNQYLSLKKECDDNKGSADWFDCMKAFWQFDGFKMALKYVGIDPGIFETNV